VSVRRLASRALTVAVVVAAVAWAIVLRPPFLGGETSYVIVSGESMEPTMHNGDLVFAREQETYARGDILVYRVPEGEPGAGVLIIHRVMGGDAATGYILQGDNRENVDPWRPTQADVRGKTEWHIPRVGLLVAFMGTPLGLATLAALIAFVLVVGRGPEQRPATT